MTQADRNKKQPKRDVSGALTALVIVILGLIWWTEYH